MVTIENKQDDRLSFVADQPSVNFAWDDFMSDVPLVHQSHQSTRGELRGEKTNYPYLHELGELSVPGVVTITGATQAQPSEKR